MHNQNLSFAKIVATPSEVAWSQVYNAGSLFLVISLTTEDVSDAISLNTLGKQVINNLEAEFFTLEKKDLPSIKSAVTTGLHEVPETVTVSLALAYVKDAVLYLLIVGSGKVIMKRQDAIGVLLESKTPHRESVTASGYISNEDTVLLQTSQFANLVTDTSLKQAFELSLPSDIAETLTPAVHASGDSAASAIVILFKGLGHTPAVIPHPHHTEVKMEHAAAMNEEDEQGTHDDELTMTERKRPRLALPALKKLKLKKPDLRLTRNIRTLLFVCLAVIITIVLIASVFRTIQMQQQTKNEAAFKQIYEAAEKDYDDGISLLSLNPEFARDDFLSAKKKIADGIPQFPKGSPEEQQLTELLQKVNNELGSGGTTNTVNPAAAEKTESPTLASLIDQSGATFAARDGDAVYTLTASDVLKDGKSIIKNDSDWTTPAGFAVYLGNVYILDKKAGVLKYVVAADGYGKTSYFGENKPNLSQAVGMTIDGSVWILFSDSRIMKFTKGQAESFSIKGLEKLFSHPSAITTTIEGTTLYILDSGNRRLVTINKDGNYKKSYVSNTIAGAKAIDVNESNSTIFFLNDTKLFKLSL